MGRIKGGLTTGAGMVERQGYTPLHPLSAFRSKAVIYDKRRYRRGNRIKIVFGRLKDWRRIATRFDRCAKTFLSAVSLTATVIVWL